MRFPRGGTLCGAEQCNDERNNGHVRLGPVELSEASRVPPVDRVVSLTRMLGLRADEGAAINIEYNQATVGLEYTPADPFVHRNVAVQLFVNFACESLLRGFVRLYLSPRELPLSAGRTTGLSLGREATIPHDDGRSHDGHDVFTGGKGRAVSAHRTMF
jgi:hypothetical protein